MKKTLIILAILLLAGCVCAHQPRLVYNLESSEQNPIKIENPEISQAFYGNLKGNPDYYKISSEEEFKFYLGVLAPAVSNARTDFTVEIFFDESIKILKKNESWDLFYEEFAGDSYFEGPELEFTAKPANYLIKVSNPGNEGKYVISVGRIENFPLDETIKTYLALPSLKMYFEKSPLTAYFNLISIPLWIILVIIIVIAIIIIKRKKKSNKKKRK
ncbi:hypothetical protein KY342_00645 [Candidatus Woesearchaeota archaeon]|nr:hypothetical protein [Candidatus Woesearchaeota archaeon]